MDEKLLTDSRYSKSILLIDIKLECNKESRSLLNASQTTPFLPLDDTLLTRLCTAAHFWRQTNSWNNLNALGSYIFSEKEKQLKYPLVRFTNDKQIRFEYYFMTN